MFAAMTSSSLPINTAYTTDPRSAVSGLFVGSLLALREAELDEAVAQRAERDPEQRGGALADAAGLLQSAHDPRALEIGHEALEIDALGRERRRDFGLRRPAFQVGELARADDLAR